MISGTPNQILLIPIGTNGDQRVALADTILTEIEEGSGTEALKVAEEALAVANEALVIANEALDNEGLSPYIDAKEVWISNQGDGGNGSLFNPYRCPDAPSLMSLLNSFGTDMVIHFLPGTFLVNSPGIKPLAGWKVRGAGIGNTILKMMDAAVPGIARGVFNNFDRSDGVEISGMTIDCNYQNQITPGWVAAIRVIGSYILLKYIKAINWGADSAEVFVIAIGNDLVNPNYYSTIDSCVVTEPAQVLFGDGATGIGIHSDGSGFTGLAVGCTVRNCYVYAVDTTAATIGCPTFFHAYSDGNVHNCVAQDLTGATAVAMYRDSSGSINGAGVETNNCTFLNVTRGIFYNMPTGHMTGLIIRNCYITVAQNGFGIEYFRDVFPYDPSAYADGVQLIGNVVVPADGTTVSTAVSLDTGRVATVLSNVFAGIGGGDDFVSPDSNTMLGNANYVGALQPELHTCTGDPNGQIVGRVGDSCNQIDAGVFIVQWQKQTGDNTNTGWV